MSSTTINARVFESQEMNLMHLASALETVGNRVLNLTDLVESCSEEERARLNEETDFIHSVLHCLSVVADESGGRAAKWRAWAQKTDVNIIWPAL